jgi:hypothetical protein
MNQRFDPELETDSETEVTAAQAAEDRALANRLLNRRPPTFAAEAPAPSPVQDPNRIVAEVVALRHEVAELRAAVDAVHAQAVANSEGIGVAVASTHATANAATVHTQKVALASAASIAMSVLALTCTSGGMFLSMKVLATVREAMPSLEQLRIRQLEEQLRSLLPAG